MTASDIPKTRRVRVDLTNSNAPVGWRSVEYEGEWSCSDEELRALAAKHCDVPIDQVGQPETVALSTKEPSDG